MLVVSKTHACVKSENKWHSKSEACNTFAGHPYITPAQKICYNLVIDDH